MNAVFVAIALLLVFNSLSLFGIDKIIDKCIVVYKALLDGKIYKTIECFTLYGGSVFFVLFLLVLLLRTSSHRRKERRKAKENRNK